MPEISTADLLPQICHKPERVSPIDCQNRDSRNLAIVLGEPMADSAWQLPDLFVFVSLLSLPPDRALL